MALFQSYESGGAVLIGSYVNHTMMQTFTPALQHELTSVQLYVRRFGTITDVIVSIYTTTGGLPTGNALVSKTIDGSGWSDSDNVWAVWTFDTQITLAVGTQYAIVIEPGSYNNSNCPLWYYDATGAYTGGSSGIADPTWRTLAYDMYFREYGDRASQPVDKTYSKELIAIGNDEVWYESTAGTMNELDDANGKINTDNLLNATIAFQKLFIVNGTNLKIADFANTKIETDDIKDEAANATSYPFRGTVVTGAGGAEMIIDYITAIDDAAVIYGKKTNDTAFVDGELVSGINSDDTVVKFDIKSGTTETAPTIPHWYDWTVYGNSTIYGAMPVRANEVCNFMGCLMLAGDPNYPHQWYMSRQFNPFDWLYTQDDAQSAVAGNDADAGEVGDIIKVNIPYKDDFVVHACASTLWYMTGHPCTGGTIVELDLTTGILGDRAFCWDDVGNLYIVCTVGLLRIPPGFGQPENLTIELWPDFITDLAFNAASHRITLAFNPEDRGIHIFKTTLADGTSSAWWYDLRTGGLFPDSYSTDHGVFSAVYYQSEDPLYRKLLFGCNDGYIRFADRTAKNDDSTEINSYVGFAPLALSTHPRKDGIIKNIDIVSGGGASDGTYQSDSSNVLCSVHVARTAEQIIEKLRSSTAAAFTKTFTAPGYQKGNIDRRQIRGQWGGIVLSNNVVDESWSMERLIVDTKEMGRSL